MAFAVPQLPPAWHAPAGYRGGMQGNARTTTRRYAALSRHSAAALAVVAALGVVSACQPKDATQSSSPATKAGDGRIRTDLEPLVSRFPALGTPRSAQWSSGTMGDPAQIGPSTYWIDAVVELDPQTTRDLTGTALHQDDTTYDLVPAIAALVPAGAKTSSPELRTKFALTDWRVSVGIVRGTDTLVLSALGGH